MTQESKVQAVGTINYQFTAIPTNLIYLLDADCLKAFSILVQKETYWRNRNMLNDGCFIKSITELSNELKLKNRKDIHTIIEALYRAKLIKVYVKPQEYKTARFYINWDYINKEYLSYSLGDAIEFLEQIQKLSRNTEITYVTNNVTKCNTTIDNINNIDNKKEIYNINNNKEIKEDAVENTASLESTNKIITDSNDELESNTKTNNTMNHKTRINIETLTARMSNSTSIEELEDKNTKFHKWLDTKLDNEELTSTEYTQQIEDINKVYNLTYSKLDNEPTEESETILDELVSDFFSLSSNDATKEQNTELGNIIIPTTKTKEQITADLEDFKNSLSSYENKEDALSNLKWYGNKWDKEIVSNDMLKSYQELLNYVTNNDKKTDADKTPTLSKEDNVKEQLENFKSTMTDYSTQKEAKKEFNSLVSKLDKEIIDFKLEELVKEIYDSINSWNVNNIDTPSICQNKPITDTFTVPSNGVANNEDKVSEEALKCPIKEVVIKEDSEEPKLHTTANTGTSVESKALAMSIFYKKPLEQVMLEIEASRASRGGIIVEEDYPFY